MSPEFSIADDATWPLVLNVEQVAAIYQRTVGAVKHACWEGRFVPAPFQPKPLRWRKADVLRDLVGGRASSHLRSA